MDGMIVLVGGYSLGSFLADLVSLDLAGNYAEHTFQAPCSCCKSGLTKDLLLSETINVIID